MNVGAYLKGAKRGDFQWECIESGGEGLSVDVEETELEKRYATIRRYDFKTCSVAHPVVCISCA